jgi:L-2-hydroxyglutarate oxidase LhgO
VAPPAADVVVVGAGVVGLACAAALAGAGRDVIVIERHPRIGAETSSRNSEVIHAGLYDPPGSLKARLCRQGREALRERCERWAIPHRRIGKLVVASQASELPALERLLEQGGANGVPGLRLLGAREVAEREPAVRAVAGLESPESGVIDAMALCASFAAEAQRSGAALALRTEVVAIEARPGGWRVRARTGGGEAGDVACAAVVNAAGLHGDRVAALAGFDVDAMGYRIHPCKGDYFALAPGAPVRVTRLIYPIPAGPGLGLHATPDLAGRIRFGPDAEYVDRVRYDIDPGKAEAFAAAVRRYLPALRAEWLRPDQAGVRPKLAGPGQAFRDFVVAEESAAGFPGFVNCLGIESPGLTASPALGARVAQLLASL